MDTSKLLHSFNDNQVDTILAGMVGIFEKVFPDRIRAYYVIGSYLDGTQLPTSDIDGYIIFKGDGNPQDFMAAMELGQECSQICPIALDFAPRPENSLLRHGTVDLKLASCIIYGEDIREEVPLLDASFYTCFAMEEGLERITEVRNDPSPLTYPLAYPDPDDEFYGYARQSTRSLLHVVGKPATAIILLSTGQHVKNKRDSVERYQAEVADEWAPLVSDVYEICRNRWHYEIPQEADDRQTLHAMCQNTLAFENHFLRLLRDFVLDQLRSTVEASGWLTLMELVMLMELPPDDFQPLLAQGLLTTRSVDGEQQVLIEKFDKHVVTRILEKIVFPGDTELVEALNQVEVGDNVLLQRAVERARKIQEQAP